MEVQLEIITVELELFHISHHHHHPTGSLFYLIRTSRYHHIRDEVDRKPSGRKQIICVHAICYNLRTNRDRRWERCPVSARCDGGLRLYGHPCFLNHPWSQVLNITAVNQSTPSLRSRVGNADELPSQLDSPVRI